jgi:hypothetical protein
MGKVTKNIPRGLKSHSFDCLYGTAEAVLFQDVAFSLARTTPKAASPTAGGAGGIYNAIERMWEKPGRSLEQENDL